jgi:hypothetical protein
MWPDAQIDVTHLASARKKSAQACNLRAMN